MDPDDNVASSESDDGVPLVARAPHTGSPHGRADTNLTVVSAVPLGSLEGTINRLKLRPPARRSHMPLIIGG